MTLETVYFAHISDSHIGPSPGYANHGIVSLPAAQRLVDRLNQLPFKPDFVVHTGDITADPHPQAYTLARETFAALRVPLYYVRGNHDAAPDIREYMTMGVHEILSHDSERLVYRFDHKGYRFLVLDSYGPPDQQPLGYLPEEQLDLVRREITSGGSPLVIFMHHPVLPMDSPWMDANMPLINGEEVHQVLRLAQDRLRGVFLGHIHQSTQNLRDGILYVAAASSFSQFTSWPNDELVQHLEDEQPGFNFVRLLPQQTMIRQHRFPLP